MRECRGRSNWASVECRGPITHKILWGKWDGEFKTPQFLCEAHVVTYNNPDWKIALLDSTESIWGVPSSQDQKGGEKMYQVTSFNLGTGALINNVQYRTLEEAQLAVETLAAGFRGDLVKKVFFTVCLLNIKTGKYYGSVSDAPPPVTLTTGE